MLKKPNSIVYPCVLSWAGGWQFAVFIYFCLISLGVCRNLASISGVPEGFELNEKSMPAISRTAYGGMHVYETL